MSDQAELRRRLVANLKDDFAVLGKRGVPLAVLRHACALGSSLTARQLGAAVGAEVLERSAFILTYRMSEFALLSCYSRRPTFKEELLIRGGLTWTSSMIVTCMLRKPVNFGTYVFDPILSGALAVGSFALDNRDEVAQFLSRVCPNLMTRLQPIRQGRRPVQ
jgi:hypothetical protein